MRNIIFEETGMENYGPYIDPMVLQIQNNKIILISGPNGIGKTMALDAIPFTFFGTTTKGIKGDNAVNNIVGKNCKTWVKFKDNADSFVVTRYQKYTKLGNTVVINKNGVDILKGSKEVIPYIEKLICPEKSFMNTLMFGQKVKDFFTDISDSDKKEIFRNLLTLEQYVLYYKKADEKLKKLYDEQEIIKRDIIVNNQLLENTQQQIKILQDAKIKYYQDNEKKVKEIISSIENEIRLLTGWNNSLTELNKQDKNLESILLELNDLSHKITRIDSDKKLEFSDLENKSKQKILELENAASQEKEQIVEKYKGVEEQLKNQKDELKTKSNEIFNKYNNENNILKISKNDQENLIKNIQSRIKEIIDNIFNANISSCPTCEQAVDENIIRKLKEKITLYEKQIETHRNIISEINNKFNLLNIEFKNENSLISDSVKKIDSSLSEVLKEKKNELDLLQEKLSDVRIKVKQLVISQTKIINQKTEDNKKEFSEKYNELSNKKQNIEKVLVDIQKAENEIREINYNINASKMEISKLQKQEYDESQLNAYKKKERDYIILIKTFETKIKEKEKLVKITEFWKNGFSSSGIPSILIDEAIPLMNEKVSYYLDMISNGRYIVSFDTLAETKKGEIRDKISVRVIDTHTKANTRVQLSGGQTRIIDIATILTLGELQSTIQNVKFNILLFDEIFDSLDDENIGYVSKVLTKIKDGKCIFLISHTNQDHIEFDEHLNFRK